MAGFTHKNLINIPLNPPLLRGTFDVDTQESNSGYILFKTQH